MKLGFSTLSLFMKSNEEILKIAKYNGFDMIELLSEGPYIPYYLLENQHLLEPYKKTDLEINIHGPSVDLNYASLNEGIRKESIKQLFQTIDLAELINGKVITVHPGQIGRNDEKLRKIAIDYSIESLSKATEYAEEKGIIISAENMPERFSFLGNRIEEIEKISEETGCQITIDLGHANTCENPAEFLDLKNISYCHLNDNDGVKDQHKSLGEGTLDLNLLKKVDKGIIELNNFENVVKSKELIKSLNL